MTRKSIFGLVCMLAVVVSGFTWLEARGDSAKFRTREEVSAFRASHPRKAHVKTPDKAPAQRVHAGDKQLYALHCSAYDGALYDWTGVVKVMAGATCPETVYDFGLSIPAFQGVYMNGKMLAVFHDAYSVSDVLYRIYDAETWENITESVWGDFGGMPFGGRYTITSTNILPYALAYDHTTDRVYGCFYADGTQFMVTDEAYFGYIDFNECTNPIKLISEELPTRMRALTFDADGQLYGMSYTGDLYTINKFTGEAEATGVNVELPTQDFGDPSAPFDSYGRESMCCDWESGDFFIAYSDDIWNSYVARFNPTTGEAEMVADYSYSDFGSLDCNILTGLYFEQKVEYGDKVVPAAPADFTVTPVGTEPKATVSFTMPAVDASGNALDADMTWTVTDGANQLATGTAHSGATVSAEVESAATGFTMFVVYVTLDGNDSNSASARAFIGCDTPKIWGLPTVRAAGSKLNVSWNAAEAANGGNLDPITYTVTRMPDEVVVATGLEETTFSDEIESDIKTLYSYVIVPVSGSVSGEPVTSRSIYYGKYIAMPLVEEFDDEARFLQYPVIDANNDSNIWEYSTKYNGVAMYPANNNDADDYLLIGPFKMETGLSYSFHMVADGHNFSETIAVYVGTDADDVNTFNYELVAPTKLEPMKGEKSFDVVFEPTENGDYYFGIKACSTGASQYIYVYEVAVKAIGGAAPAAPSDFEAVPGATTATLNFTLPSKTIGGDDLTELTQVNIYRDNVLVGTLTDGLTPGTAASYTDTDDVTKGYHNYSVLAVNAEGEGKPASAQLWRGADFPGRPTNLRIWEDLETPGLMHLTFDAPARGYYGGYVDPDDITYILDYLVMGAGAGVVELGKGTEHTFRLPFEATAQDIFAGSVYGRNSNGSVANSTNWTTQVAYFGPALSLPVQESWKNMSQRNGIWGGQALDEDDVTGESYWDISNATAQIMPQDNDGGMLALKTTVDNGGKRILSPRVSVAGTETPALVFYYNYTKDATEFNLEVIVDDQPIRVYKNIELTEADALTWHRMEVALDEFKTAKYIQFGFAGRGNAGDGIIAVDNVTMANLLENNLTVTAFEAPAKADVNTEARIAVAVRNNGSKAVAADAYTVRFYKNGELLEEQQGWALNPDETAGFGVYDVVTVTDPEENEYYAEVVFAADQKADDNKSVTAKVQVIISDYPTVTNLREVSSAGEVVIAWDEPDESLIPGQSVTESFEFYNPFITSNFGEWGVYDGDGCTTLILATSYGVLDYPNIGTPMAWQVFNPLQANIFHSAWYGHTGEQMLVSFQTSTNGSRTTPCNDWLISPELNGAEQTITFYAQAGMAGYAPEVFDFMISNGSSAPADFTALASDVEIPYSGWIEFKYTVPAGTRYFAIVHKSVEKMAMMVDDITYIPAGSQPVEIGLQGYYVYRDGVRLTDLPVAETTYTDSNVEEKQSHTYNVTAVWDKGESRLSEPLVVLVTSGLANVEDYTLTISGNRGFIRIEGGVGELAEVYNVTGQRVAAVTTEGTVDVAVGAAGVYVVRVGSTVAKVVVR